MHAQLAAVLNWLEATDLPAEARETLAGSLKQLPGLGQEFLRTYESRYAEQALRLEQQMLSTLGHAQAVSQAPALLEHLGLLHEALGLPALDPKLQAAPQRRTARRKAG